MLFHGHRIVHFDCLSVSFFPQLRGIIVKQRINSVIWIILHKWIKMSIVRFIFSCQCTCGSDSHPTFTSFKSEMSCWWKLIYLLCYAGWKERKIQPYFKFICFPSFPHFCWILVLEWNSFCLNAAFCKLLPIDWAQRCSGAVLLFLKCAVDLSLLWQKAL